MFLFIFHIFLLFRKEVIKIIIMYFLHHSTKGQKTDYIRHNHHTVEAVRHIPYKIYLRQRPQEYTDAYQYRVDRHCLGSEQIFDICLTEEIPSHDRGKCKEEHADCNKYLSAFSIYKRICKLAKCRRCISSPIDNFDK